MTGITADTDFILNPLEEEDKSAFFDTNSLGAEASQNSQKDYNVISQEESEEEENIEEPKPVSDEEKENEEDKKVD